MANNSSKDEMREALTDVSLWLRSALNCKQWVWDSDQRLAAMGCLATADELLKSPAETSAMCFDCELAKRDGKPACRQHRAPETPAPASNLVTAAQAVLDRAQVMDGASDYVMVHREVIGNLREALRSPAETEADAQCAARGPWRCSKPHGHAGRHEAGPSVLQAYCWPADNAPASDATCNCKAPGDFHEDWCSALKSEPDPHSDLPVEQS